MVTHEEEGIALLDEHELNDQDSNVQSGVSSEEEVQSWPFIRQRRKWFAASLIVVGLVITAVLVLTFALSLHARHDRFSEHGQSRFLGFELHPQDHVSRPPGILEYNWIITAGLRSPDGVQKRVYLVNDKFPGPTIEARPGDRIIVHAHNHLDDEGVSLHWHGLRLKGQNRMDGAVGFTQCSIPSGKSFTYNFTIGDDEAGTYWWHSHSDVQRADGLWGGFIVHSLNTSDSPVEETLLMIGDWFHRGQKDVLKWYADANSMGNEPVPDSMLINGHGRFDCAMAVPARPVNCTQTASNEVNPILRRLTSPRMRIRLINTGSIAGFTVGIDHAMMKPVRLDGGFTVQSDATNAVGILYPGERVDIDVEWTRHPLKSSWLTVYLDDENFGYPNPALNPNQSFPMYPLQQDLGSSGVSGQGLNLARDGLPSLHPQRLKAATPIKGIPRESEETIVLYAKTELLAHLDYAPVGFINHTSWKPQTPPLLGQKSSSWDNNQLVPSLRMSKGNPKWVTIVINNLDDGAHPFHLHGYHFYLISSYRERDRGGWGSYNPYSGEQPPNKLDLDFPLRKDTVIVPRRGHVVLAFLADNPGIWALHCHMLVHMVRGMAMGLNIIEEVPGQDRNKGLDGNEAPDTQAMELCPSNNETISEG